MLKRTTGRLLLALLVVTGLAGTLNTSSLSQKERKQAITLIKESRAAISTSVDGLSDKQLNFKPAPGQSSIAEMVTMLVLQEKKCNDEIRRFMNQPSNPESRLKIALTDEQLLAKDNSLLCRINAPSTGKEATNDPKEALKKFNLMRTNQVKYIRTSTEDLRNHVVSTPVGWIDCYQYYLLLADRSNYVAQKINEIKELPAFPKN